MLITIIFAEADVSTFQLQVLILVILFLMALSLFNGLYVLLKDDGNPNTKRTFYRLSVRATLAAALLATMIYGFYTGKLESQAPWNRPTPTSQPAPQQPVSPPQPEPPQPAQP